MEIIRLNETHCDEAARLIDGFRTALCSYKGISRAPDPEAGKREFLELLKAGRPVFAAREDGRLIGYIACRIEDTVLWVEEIYVCEEYRRRGAASLLFRKAEELAESMGEDTVYNYVHPNNEGMIGFLRNKGYTVLNLIEIRKPYRNEKLTTKIRVDRNEFDY